MAYKIIAVLAVHDEEHFLPYSLEAIIENVDLVVAVIDNCSDDSEKILDSFGSKIHKVYLKKHIWKNFIAETKYVGLQEAKKFCTGDQSLILMVDCDLVVDSFGVSVARLLFGEYGFFYDSRFDAVVFSYKQYSLDGSVFHRFKDELLNLFGKYTKKFTNQPIKTGIYLVRSNKVSVEDVISEYENVLSKLKTYWISTSFKHLRPRYDRKSQMLMGISRATIKDYNLLKVVLYSLFTLSPYVLTGFLTAKTRKIKK